MFDAAVTESTPFDLLEAAQPSPIVAAAVAAATTIATVETATVAAVAASQLAGSQNSLPDKLSKILLSGTDWQEPALGDPKNLAGLAAATLTQDDLASRQRITGAPASQDTLRRSPDTTDRASTDRGNPSIDDTHLARRNDLVHDMAYPSVSSGFHAPPVLYNEEDSQASDASVGSSESPRPIPYIEDDNNQHDKENWASGSQPLSRNGSSNTRKQSFSTSSASSFNSNIIRSASSSSVQRKANRTGSSSRRSSVVHPISPSSSHHSLAGAATNTTPRHTSAKNAADSSSASTTPTSTGVSRVASFGKLGTSPTHTSGRGHHRQTSRCHFSYAVPEGSRTSEGDEADNEGSRDRGTASQKSSPNSGKHGARSRRTSSSSRMSKRIVEDDGTHPRLSVADILQTSPSHLVTGWDDATEALEAGSRPMSLSSSWITAASIVIIPLKVKDFAFPCDDPRFIGEPAPQEAIQLPSTDDATSSWYSRGSPNPNNGTLDPAIPLLSSSSSSSICSSNFTPPPFGSFGHGHRYHRPSQDNASGAVQSSSALSGATGSFAKWAQSSALSDNDILGSRHSTANTSKYAWNFVTDSSAIPVGSAATERSDEEAAADAALQSNLLSSALAIESFDNDFVDEDSDEEDTLSHGGTTIGPSEYNDEQAIPSIDPAEAERRDISDHSFTVIPRGGLLYRAMFAFTAEAEAEMDLAEGGESFQFVRYSHTPCLN